MIHQFFSGVSSSIRFPPVASEGPHLPEVVIPGRGGQCGCRYFGGLGRIDVMFWERPDMDCNVPPCFCDKVSL